MSQPQPEIDKITVPNLLSAWNADLSVTIEIGKEGSDPVTYLGCYSRSQNPALGSSVDKGTGATIQVSSSGSSPTPIDGKVTVGDYVSTMKVANLAVTLQIVDSNGTTLGNYALASYRLSQDPVSGAQVDLNSVVVLTLSSINR